MILAPNSSLASPKAFKKKKNIMELIIIILQEDESIDAYV
jgi:hypothetical protein